jgi:hypothetical protein
MTVRSEYVVGDYLFGIADAYAVTERMKSFDGIVVMKAGDTHWQKFVEIIDPTNTSQ